MRKSLTAKKAMDVPFAQISNTLICDSRLSPSARWVAIYILSKPINWIVHVKDIQNQAGHFDSGKPHMGRDKVYACFRELVKVGFAERTQERDKSGKITGHSFTVHNTPICAPEPDTPEPDIAEPDIAEPHAYKDGNNTNTDCLDNTTGKTAIAGCAKTQSLDLVPSENKKPRKRKSPYSDEFQAFWIDWPSSNKKRKEAAWLRYKRLTLAERGALENHCRAYKASSKERHFIQELANFIKDTDLQETIEATKGGGQIIIDEPKATHSHTQQMQQDYRDVVAGMSGSSPDGANFGPSVDVFG